MAALCWTRAAGCTHYDWWGAPDVLDESDCDPLISGTSKPRLTDLDSRSHSGVVPNVSSSSRRHNAGQIQMSVRLSSSLKWKRS